MKNKLITLLLVISLFAVAAPAQAQRYCGGGYRGGGWGYHGGGWGGWGGGCYRGGWGCGGGWCNPGVFLGIAGIAAAGAIISSAVAPPPVYYPQPVYYAQGQPQPVYYAENNAPRQVSYASMSGSGLSSSSSSHATTVSHSSSSSSSEHSSASMPQGFVADGYIHSPWSDSKIPAANLVRGQKVYDPVTGQAFKVP